MFVCFDQRANILGEKEMKTVHWVKKGLLSAAGFLALTLILTTCQAVSAGLGPKVDLYPPTLTVTTPTANQYLKGAISVTGKATDDISLKSVSVTWNTSSGSTTQPATLNSDGTWSYTIPSGTTDPTNLPDGQQTITVTANATSGKATQVSVIIFVDNIPPTVLVNTPSSHGTNPPIYSDYVDITGSAWDPSPISKVVVTLFNGSTQIAQQQANGTSTWSARFKLKDTDGGPLTSANDGNVLSYQIAVTDAAGNTSTYYYHQQDIFNILPANTLFPTTTEIGQLDQAGSGVSSPSGIPFATLAGTRLTGSAGTPWANLKFSYLSLPTLIYFNLNPTAIPQQNLLGPGAGIYGSLIPPSTPAINASSLQFQLWNTTDYYAFIGGNTSKTPIITLTSTNTYGSQLTLTPVGGSENFNVALKDPTGTNLPPGSYTVTIQAAAQGSGTLSTSLNFMIDANAPVLTETNLGNSLVYKNASFTMGGQAQSASGLQNILIEQSTDGGSTYPNSTTVTLGGASATNVSWTSPTLPLPQPNPSNGSYSYRLTLTAVSGKTTILYRSVIYDTTPPTVNIISPANGAWELTSPVTIQETATDPGAGATGVAKVYYLIDTATNNHASDITTWDATNGQSPPTSSTSASWQTATSSSSFDTTVNLTTQGQQKLWVVAVDNAGNLMTSAATSTFGFDNAPPVLTETDTVPAVTNAGFTLSGNVSDTDPASVPGSTLTVTVSVNGSAPQAATVTAGGTWSFAQPVPATPDGNYTYIIKATDVSGQTTTLSSKNVLLDTTPPTVTPTSPVPSTWLTSGSVSLSGAVTDGAGSGASKVWVLVDAASYNHTGDVTTWSATNGALAPVNAAPGSTATWQAAPISSSVWTATATLTTEGQKTLWVVAVDNAGNTTKTAITDNFGYDLAPPTLTETAVGTTTQVGRNAAFTLSGNLGDSDQIANIKVEEQSTNFNSGNYFTVINTAETGTSASWTTDNSNGGTGPVLPLKDISGTISVPSTSDFSSHAMDGLYTFRITATDIAGKTTILTRTVQVDTTPPTLGAVSSPSANAWILANNPTFTGSVTDPGASPSGVAAVYLLIDTQGTSHASDVTSWAATSTITPPTSSDAAVWVTATGTATWTYIANLTSEGLKTLWIVAVDNAGNKTVTAQTVNFGYDTAPPSLTETALGVTSQVIEKTGFSLTGSVSDSDPASVPASAGGTTLTVSVSINGGAAQAATITGATSPYTWSFAQPTPATPDGKYTYTIIATDAAGRTTNLTRIALLDTTPPSLTTTGPLPNQWLSSTPVVVNGIATDGAGSGVAQVYYIVDAANVNHSTDLSTWTGTAAPTSSDPGVATWQPAALSGSTWTASVSMSTQGLKTVWVAGVDIAGNPTTPAMSTSTAVSFGYDTAPPVLTETTAQVSAGSFVVGKKYVIESLGTTDFTAIGATSNTVGLTFTATGAGSGTGVAGNDSRSLSTAFSFSGIDTDTDTYNPAFPTLSVSVDGGAATPVSVTSGTGAWTYNVSVDTTGHSNDGLHTYTFTATDVAGKTTILTLQATIDTQAPVATFANISTNSSSPTALTSPSLKVLGNITDTSGVATMTDTIAYSPDNGTTWNPIESGVSLGTPGGSTSTTFNKDVSSTTTFPNDGLYRISVSSTDTATPANAGTSVYGYFRLDRTAPSLTLTAPNNNSAWNQSFSITGTASSANLASVAYAIDSGSFTTMSGPFTPGTTYNINVLYNPTALSEGAHTLTVQATSLGGLVTTKPITFYEDHSAPVNTFTNLTTGTTLNNATVLQSSTPAITGSVTDLTGIAKIETLIETSNDGTTWTVKNNWTSIGTPAGNTNYTWSQDLSSTGLNLPEGLYRVTVRTTDIVTPANVATGTPVLFRIDRTAPTLAITSPTTLSAAYNAAFTVTGTAQAAGWPNIFSITATLDGTTPVSIIPTYNSTTGVNSWTYSVSAATFSGLAQGPHTLVFTATDYAGLVSSPTTGTLNFNVDTQPPVIAYNNIATSGVGYPTVLSTTSTPNLTGTLTDASGVASASYTLNVYNYATSTWNPVMTAVPITVTGKPLNTTWAVPLTGLSDGYYQVSLSATDIVAPTPNTTASPSLVNFYVSNGSPSATVTAPNLGSWVNGNFTLVGTLQDSTNVTGVSAVASTSSNPSFASATAASPAQSIISISSAGVFTTNLPHGLTVGATVYIAGNTLPSFTNGTNNLTLSPTTAYNVASVSSSVSGQPADQFTLTALSGYTLSSAGSGLFAAKSGTSFTSPPQIPVVLTGGASPILTTTSALLANGNFVYFTGTLPIATPAVTAGTAYYVTGVSGSTFNLATAPTGGTTLTFTSSGNATLYSPSITLGWMVPNLPLTSVSNGAFTAYTQVTSADGKSTVASRSFSLDNVAPTITMTSPSTTSISTSAAGSTGPYVIGGYNNPLNGLISIAGTTTDSGSGVSQNIQYHLGKSGTMGSLGYWQTGTSASNWVISLGDISSYANTTNGWACDAAGGTTNGNYWLIPISFLSTDNAGNQTITTDYLVYNSNANTPVIAISSPPNAQTFGGQQRIYGTASQPVGVYSAEVYVDPTDGSTPPLTIPTSVLSNSTTFTFTTPLGTPLPANTVVYIKSIAQYPSLPGGATAGTPYYVIGSTSTTTSFQVSATSGGVTAISFTSGIGTTFAVDQWAPATLMTQGTNVSWYYDINTGNVYPNGTSQQTVSVTARAWSATSFGGPRGNFVGNLLTPLTMTFNNTFPTVTISTLTPQGGSAQTYTQGMDARSTFTLAGTVSTPIGLATLNETETGPYSGTTAIYTTTTSYGTQSGTISANGDTYTVTPQSQLGSGVAVTYVSGQSYKLLITNPGSNTTPGSNPWVALGLGATVTPAAGISFTVTAAGNVPSGASAIESDATGKFNYAFTLTVSSSSIYPSVLTGNYQSGTYGFNLQASDLTLPTAQVSTTPASVNVDNFYPTSNPSAGPYLTNPILNTSGPLNGYYSLTGTTENVSGSATDFGTNSGPIGAISKIVVYLTNTAGTTLYSLAASTTTSPTSLTALDATGSGTVTSVPYPSTSSYTGYYANISQIGSGYTGADGFTESLTLNGSSENWSVALNTTLIPDGAYKLHYVVFDQAGNATHYSVNAFITNNAPGFGSVTLGTSVGGSAITQNFTTVASLAPTNLTANFTAESNTLSFTVNSTYGNGTTTPNGALSYTLTYGGTNYWSQGTVTAVGTNTAKVTFNPTTVSPVIPDTSTTNGATFTLTVTDSTPGVAQSYSIPIAMNIQNQDHGTPQIAVAPFGQQYVVPVVHNTSSPFFNTQAVTSYSQNIGSSGGHIDYTSPYTASAAAVSGQVVFLGSAWNDQAMTKITATIPGFNGGTEFTIATFAGGTWTPGSGTGWSAAIDTADQVLGLSGQQVNWTFTWDSSKITTVAQKNITVSFKAYNSNPTLAQAVSSPTTSLIDVVPYISAITDPNGLTSDVLRSSTGKYSVGSSTSNTLTVQGYNLGSASYLPSSYISAAPITTPSGQNPATTFVSTSQVNVAKTMSTIKSGWLTIFVNGVPSTNNLNNNAANLTTFSGSTVNYNTEVDPTKPYSTQWNDDRYLWFWNVTSLSGANGSTTKNYYYPDMLMSGNQPLFTFDDNTSGYNYVTTSDTANASTVGMWYERQGAFKSDGSTNYVVSTEDAFGGGIGSLMLNIGATPGAAAIDANTVAPGASGEVLLVSEDWTSRQLNRFMYPKMIVDSAGPPTTANGTEIYIAVNDRHPSMNDIRLWTLSKSETGFTQSDWTVSGSISNSYVEVPGTAGLASPYFAMTKIGASSSTTQKLFIAWYDQVDQKLVLSWISNPLNANGTLNTTLAGNAANWNTTVIEPAGGFAGTDVSMTTNGTNLYLAYYDSANANLKFAIVSGSTFSTVQTFVVDSYLSEGTWTQIQLANGVPYISYYSPSYNGTKKPIRLAFPTNGTGGVSTANIATNGANTSNDSYTGTWEVVTIPANSAPQGGKEEFNHVNIGMYSNNGLTLPVLGYLGSSFLEYAKLQPNN
jgi:hypothetical protein